jgi:hypothetical protein
MAANLVTEAYLVSKGLLLPGKSASSKKTRASNSNKKTSKVSKEVCLVPGCTNKPHRRGLCNTHRVMAYQAMKDGTATEAELIKKKLILPKGAAPKRPSKPAKYSEKSCLLQNCTRKRHGRGLCKSHYSRLQRQLAKLSNAERTALEQELVRKKQLLPKKESVSNSSGGFFSSLY